ncbi:hypothetical protein [Mucilaginibacter sp. KACC 22063]|uniref:hypothetical protein n=1 Tax=Mucilaginibacter sp. KACC 22063 TaxID=3025666 RepID=UPI002366B5CB|nr:hypothetical protein [Mucilaginibacter sp. KACC 22063]WDF54896.1 hypothetical protein PQ461_18360 [Mucilaginibacter sp. KACC 22063]
MKVLNRITICLLLLTFAACKSKPIQADLTKPFHGDSTHHSIVNEVSLITLIANPDRYNGKQVRVIGYLNLEFEANSIYLHEDDYRQSIDKNGLWIEFKPDSTHLLEKAEYNHHYVLMEGTFSKTTGHMNGWSGSIENVTRLENHTQVTRSPISNRKR